jgi:ubiquinone/menaquinone biosynthesis C-methylase UbiE
MMSSKNKGYNIFLNQSVAYAYDGYYLSDAGKKIDKIEKQIVSLHLNNIIRGPMLELGCGTGHWTDYFSSKGFTVTAIDESETMIKIANSKNIQSALFMKADASSLPFSDHSFSVISTITMLEFVDDSEVILNETDRVLKPGGTLIVGCLNKFSELGKNKDNDPVCKNGNFFSIQEITDMLSRFGKPFINYGVYFSSDFALLDGTDKQETVQPSFIAASVRKNQP